MRFGPKAALGVAALVGALALGTAAHAAIPPTVSVNKCLSGKLKQDGKGAAGYAGCYAKGAAKAVATDPNCITKLSAKSVATYGKLELKPPCLTTLDATTADNAAQAYAASLDTLVGHGGAMAVNGKCDSAKQKLVGKYVASVLGCVAKGAGKTGIVDLAPLGCVGKVLTKTNAGITKAQLGSCTNTNDAIAAANAFVTARVCALDPTNPNCAPPTCNNGANDPGEKCDPTAPSSGWAVCGSDFTCTALCNCACPSSVTFSGDAFDPASILDTGWTGISHRAPIISNGDVTVNVSCSATSRPCGTCGITGLAPNPAADAGQLNDRRCSNDSSIKCTSDAICGGGNTCKYYFGSALPLSAGGVSACVVNQFSTNVTGTANIESGSAATVAKLDSRVFLGAGAGDPIDHPCPRCIGDTTINDGIAGGTCDSGTRTGLPCDGNGLAPGRPDFGTTSLDCPLAGSGIALLPIDLTNSTGTVTKTLSASSPKCRATGFTTFNCLCDTCNNAAATICASNADCTAVGATVCGGKRCLGGGNNGNPCTVLADCPGGQCNVPGVSTAPSGCNDDTSTAALDCVDNGDGEGTCTQGPPDSNCTVASGHAQRGCLNDAACGGGVNSCATTLRQCFLTGGFAATELGTNNLSAVGMADSPMQDTAHPTLGAVFCTGPVGSTSINQTSGLPGPGRVTIRGNAKAHP